MGAGRRNGALGRDLGHSSTCSSEEEERRVPGGGTGVMGEGATILQARRATLYLYTRFTGKWNRIA